jgi:hypothetical protein
MLARIRILMSWAVSIAVAWVPGTGLSAAEVATKGTPPVLPPGPSSEPRLGVLVGKWAVTRSTFPGSENATFVVRRVARERGLQSVWTHGTGDGRYEAVALWGYDSASRQVRVLEVNSLGVAELHVGAFDDAGSLLLERRSPDTKALIERRLFKRSADMLHMTASFYADGHEVEHSVTLVRR